MKTILNSLAAALGLFLAAAPRGATAQTPPPALAGEDGDANVHRLVGLLDYLAADYGGAVKGGVVVSEEEFEEQKSLAEEAVSVARELAARIPNDRGVLVASVEEFAAEIAKKGDEGAVAERARRARKLVLERFDVRLAPDAPPDLERGALLYSQNCAICHGASGDAQTERAKALTPPPLTFLGEKAHGVLSPYHVFNVMTFGVPGTSMASFSLMAARDRWDVAFYTVALRHPGAKGARPDGLPALSLSEVANSADAVLEARLEALGRSADERARDLAWLRRSPPAEEPREGRLSHARGELARALASYREGRADEAGKLALDSYLRDLEPMEGALRAMDRGLTTRLESGFVALRSEIRGRGTPAAVARVVESLDRDLATAEAALASQSGSAFVPFLASALIVLREGIEAALLIAAVLGLLRKLGRKDSTGPVHWGWVLALAAGLATWWLARTVISVTAAERELVEGIVGLLAAAMLAYTSYWILSRADAKRWLEFVRGQVTGAIERRGKAALFGIAFLAVYREAFETVLFYEALAAERGSGAALPLLLGFAAGCAVLVLAILAIFKLSRRLPMKAFFTISGALLYLLAFVFAGSAVHALIEGGYLDPRPIRFPRIEWLGVYPDGLSIALQAVFVLAVGLGLLVELRSRKTAVAA